MHVQVGFYSSPFLLEKHWQKKPRPECASQSCEQSRSSAGPELSGRATVLGHEVAPYDYMPVFDRSESSVNVLPPGVGFGLGEDAVEVGGIRFILPVMLEGVQVRL